MEQRKSLLKGKKVRSVIMIIDNEYGLLYYANCIKRSCENFRFPSILTLTYGGKEWNINDGVVERGIWGREWGNGGGWGPVQNAGSGIKNKISRRGSSPHQPTSERRWD